MGYVEDAEKVFKDWYSTRDKKITTSKIRGLLSGMSDIYNDVVRVEGEELPQDIVDRIQYLKVQFVYEYGRDDKKDGPVRRFINESKILKSTKSERVRRNLLRWNDIWKHWWLITDFTAERMNKND